MHKHTQQYKKSSMRMR